MNKCKKCGVEFEGKFCPECGAPWLAEGEKICPKCKAVLKANAKFCSECGYSFEKLSAPKPVAPKPAPAHTGSWLLVAYKIAGILPEVLFLLFGVLAFIFLAAPVTKITSTGLFLGAVDVGNGYDVVSLSGVDGLRDPAIAFIVFAALGAVFALMGAFRAWGDGKHTPLSYGFFVFYLVYMIIASVMIANTAALDEGLGVFGAGACPICFLVFSILFAVGQAASLIAYNFLKNNSDVEAAQAAKEEAEKARRTQFYATHKKPVMRTPQTKKNAVIYKYEKRYYDEGKEKTPSAALVFLDMHKVALGIAAVALIVAIILMATLIPYANNKFRVGVVEEISLGDSKKQVADVLGEPYGEDRTSNDWFYYDDDLLSYVEKGQSLAKQQEDALAQGNFTQAEQLAQEAKNLQEQMNSKAFKCIEITFTDNEVESVLFDTRYSSAPKAKEAKSYALLGDVLMGYYVDETVSPIIYQSVGATNVSTPYEVHFTDGSYYKTYIKTGGTLEIKSEGYTFLWNDKYGNYSEKIAERGFVHIGTVDKDGAWIADSAGITKLQLSEVVLPDSVTSVKDLCLLSYKNLTYNQYGNALYIGSSTNPYLVLVKAEDTTITECEINAGTKVIYNDAFRNCTNLTGITVPDGVISIGENAFYDCSRLESVTIGSSVTEIGNKAFYYCSGLTSVLIPDSVTEIGEDVFYGCSGLTGELKIPDGVTSIKNHAFYHCSKLTSVKIGSGVTSIGINAFDGCSKLTRIEVPDSVTSIGDGAFRGCSGLESVAWNAEDCTTAGSSFGLIFRDCKKLQTVTFGANVKIIPAYTFRDCSGLTSITIPDSVTSIGMYAFSGCSGLEHITVAAGNRTYRSAGDCLIEKGTNSLLFGCKNSQISNGVTSIGDLAFSGCSELTSITIPDSVTEIGIDAFYKCDGLERVNITNLAAWCKIDFENGTANPLHYAHHLYLDGKEVTKLKIPAGITEIKRYAFYDCSGLTSVTFSVTEGWKVSASFNMSNATAIQASNLQNPTTAAEYLKDIYSYYYWKRS